MNESRKLTPEYGGSCALAAALKRGSPDLPAGNPDISATVDGRLYLFSNSIARTIWRFTAAPSGKLWRWIVLIVIVAALVWLAARVIA